MSIDICKELHQNFIDFAYEANSQRAFPDARDGLKPGQRACLWEFYTKGYTSAKAHVKCAKIAGGVIADWWPHGDQAIYDTFVRMSQPWINNIPEVDFHGANGNQIISGDAASSRYTEARLAKAIEEGMFQGIKKNNVPMIPNFSEDKEWPEVLPAILPRLLINGSQGIGVTVANHWSLFNLGEIIPMIEKYITIGELDYSNLMPDFPTGGILINKKDIHTIHETGKGKIIIRAQTEIKGNSILVTELPYQVYVEPLIDKIKTLIESEQIKGIDEIYNKCDKKHLLIEIQCTDNPSAVLTKLFSLTDLQKSFSPNQYALVGKTPKLLTLKDYLDIYITHNEQCIQKEYEFDYQKAQQRKEIVSGLLKALEDIDNIIDLIKKSDSSADATVNLIKQYNFTGPQAKAIVSMRLGTLARLEAVELNQESAELDQTIQDCIKIMGSQEEQSKIFLTRLLELGKKYAKPRRTQITQIEAPAKEDKEIEYVEPEKCVVVLTEGGAIKRIPANSFKTQKRNGKGIKTQDDITNAIIRTNTIDNLMVFTNKGKMYRLLVDNIPSGTNASKGVSIKSLVELEPGEEPTLIYSIYRDTNAKFVIFATKEGIIKKTPLDEYIQTKKKTGMAAIKLREGDELAAVSLTSEEDIILISRKGQLIRIKNSDIAASSRATIGSKGMGLNDDDELIAMLPIRDETDCLAIFSVTGQGKRVKLSDIELSTKGTKGIKYYKDAEVAAACLVAEDDHILIVGLTNSICVGANEIPIMSRIAMGNGLIKNRIKTVSKV
jgi:DNA gyrase subunit A